MEQSLSRFKLTAKSLEQLFHFRPYTGKLWLDSIFLLIVSALQHTIIPSLTHSLILVDLITPWLVTLFVVETLPRAAFLGALGALLIETHSAAPAGLYLCAYWVIAVVLRLSRATLSWRHAFPWMVTFFVSEVWVIIFESFVIGVTHGYSEFDLGYGFTQLLRLVTAVGIGSIFCRRWLNPFEESELTP